MLKTIIFFRDDYAKILTKVQSRDDNQLLFYINFAAVDRLLERTQISETRRTALQEFLETCKKLLAEEPDLVVRNAHRQSSMLCIIVLAVGNARLTTGDAKAR